MLRATMGALRFGVVETVRARDANFFTAGQIFCIHGKVRYLMPKRQIFRSFIRKAAAARAHFHVPVNSPFCKIDQSTSLPEAMMAVASRSLARCKMQRNCSSPSSLVQLPYQQIQTRLPCIHLPNGDGDGDDGAEANGRSAAWASTPRASAPRGRRDSGLCARV